MLHKKQGFPEEGEIVMCNVTSVQYHSVFVKLTEYNKTGMIHISEISPGRIRNIRDYVSEGKVIVCKVLRVKRDRDQIDLSLRRVNENQRKRKINELKQEQIAEKIIEYTAKKNNMKVEELFTKIRNKILKDYETVYEAFEHVLEDNNYLSKLGLDKKISSELTLLILDRIKPPSVTVRKNFTVNSYEENGVEVIKKVLSKQIKDKISIHYQGGGKYYIEYTTSDYKLAEEKIANIFNKIKEDFSKTKTEFLIK